MSTAQHVKDVCERSIACSFEYGYAFLHDNKTAHFSIGKRLKEQRNDKGRCTLALYEYEDGSRLEFTYRNETARVRVILP